MEYIIGHYNYWMAIILMLLGIYIAIAQGNLIKKLVGLGIFQTAVFLIYISLGKVTGGTPPIMPIDIMYDVLDNGGTDPTVYSNPLPHVLILTAIVVGIATTSVGLALVIRIKESYGTIEEDEIYDLDKIS